MRDADVDLLPSTHMQNASPSSVCWEADSGKSRTLNRVAAERMLFAEAEDLTAEEIEREREARVRWENVRALREFPGLILALVQRQRAVFTEAGLRQELKMLIGGATTLEVERLTADIALASSEIRTVPRDDGGETALFMTAARAAVGQNLVVGARELAASRLCISDTATDSGGLSGSLNEGQRRAAEAILGPERLTLVKGHAGTGKTFTLAEVARIWRERGFEVLGAAPSGKAVQELAGIKGMVSATLAAWEARWSRGDFPCKGHFVLVMDEAGMVGADQWLRVQDRVAALGGKLIAVGDPEQLQPISDAAGWWPAEQGAGSAHVIGQVIRQGSAGDRQATEALARGGPGIAEAIQHYEGQGALRLEGRVLADPVRFIVDAWFAVDVPESGKAKDSPGRIALAYTNRDVWALNAAIRQQALIKGKVSAGRVRSYGDITRIERHGPKSRRIKVPLELGTGDRIVLTRPHRELGLPRSAFGTVRAAREGEIDVSMDGTGQPATLDLSAFRHVDYGYASTVHRSQGMTVDHTFVLGHRLMHRHAIYVALSRHRKSVTVFGRNRHLESIDDLLRLARTAGHFFSETANGRKRDYPSSARSATGLGVDLRHDWIGHGPATRGVAVLGDMHLAGVADRVAGLLASDYTESDPVIGEDTQAYTLFPECAVHDLAKRQSVFRADEIADSLARATREPNTFMRLFYQAMTQPCLVSLSETGCGGEGRVYTTDRILEAELCTVNRGVRLALSPPANRKGKIRIADRDLEGLVREQREALAYATAPGRLRLVCGSAGSGKTLIAARITGLFAGRGWKVVGLGATGTTVGAMRKAGLGTARTMGQFVRELEGNRVSLDTTSIIVLDDAGRLGSRAAGHLLKLIDDSGASLVALLDNNVQPTMGAGPVFRVIAERAGAAHMSRMHGRSPDRAEMLKSFAQGGEELERALAKLDNDGAVVACETKRKSLEELAKGYVRDIDDDRVALAWSRKDADRLAELIRNRMDRVDPFRGRFRADATGALTGLKPGDRLRFVAGAGWRKGGTGCGQRILAGDSAEVLGRGPKGGLLLRIAGRHGKRIAEFTVDTELPKWRFAFSGTIHGELGRSCSSVHLMASRGMNRQLLVSAMNLHASALRMVVPVSEDKKLDTLREIGRRDATARSVLDLGFAVDLGAREAICSHPRPQEPGRTQSASGILWRFIAAVFRMGGCEPLPKTWASEILAEVIGAAVFLDGKALGGLERLAVERHIASLVGFRRWRWILPGLSENLRARADRLAGHQVGQAGTGMVTWMSRMLVRGALLAEVRDDRRNAELFKIALLRYNEHRCAMSKTLMKLGSGPFRVTPV